MKSGKIKFIWSLSIATALFVILLQGYWLYNQYRFTLEKTANETSEQILSAWDVYKSWTKAELKAQRENLKSFNTNLEQNNNIVFVSDTKESTTEWNISIRAIKNNGNQLIPSTSDETKVAKIANSTKGPNATNSTDSVENPMKKTKVVLNSLDYNQISNQMDTLLQHDPTKKMARLILDTDTTVISNFRFKTTENQNLVYEAVDLYLTDMNTPFSPENLDSLLFQKTANPAIRIDTLTLPEDSALWQPIIHKNLSITHPSVRVEIPYNILMRKVAQVTVPVEPTHVIKTMAAQIIVSVIFLLVLFVCLLLQLQTISRQQRTSKLRQNFVNTTIHELRRPIQTLKTIVAYLQQSSSGDSGNGESKMLENARVETDNLTSYLQKLREVNQAESMAGSLQFSYFDFTAVITDCIENARKNAGKPIWVDTHFSETPLSITADKLVMHNIVVNLLENAVKYTGENATIRVCAEKGDNNLTFSVSDNGIGIATSEQNHVFEPFYRSKNGYVASLPGMGLGLSYVKMAVEAHKGIVEITSKPDHGTTVTIKIPRQ